MDTAYRERRNQCPYCYQEFKHGEWDDAVEFTCNHCGNDFTLGEARRGKPDAPVMVAQDVAALTGRVATLETQLAETRAIVDMLNAVVGRMLPA